MPGMVVGPEGYLPSKYRGHGVHCAGKVDKVDKDNVDTTDKDKVDKDKADKDKVDREDVARDKVDTRVFHNCTFSKKNKCIAVWVGCI